MSLRSLLGITVLCVGICGCGNGEKPGPKLAATTGTVTYNNKPVPGATVTFINKDGEMSNGTTDAAGKFNMTTGGRAGVPVGTVRVGVTKMSGGNANPSATKSLTPEDMRKMQMAGGGTAPDLTPKNELPNKYADPKGSGLTATIDEDAKKNDLLFPLVD